MKHNGIIALVFVVGCATGGIAAQLVVPPVRAGTSPTRWEYQCVTADPDPAELTAFHALIEWQHVSPPVLRSVG